jgi:rhodanese-related sulfurtransferase
MLDYEVSPADADQLFRDKAAKIIDVREPWEFATAHIEGSVPIPMGEIPARASQELDSADRLIIVCHHGVRSMNVTAWLRGQGFERAQSLQGGIDAWSTSIDPKVGRY